MQDFEVNMRFGMMERKESGKFYALSAVAVIFLVLIDQASKFIAVHKLKGKDPFVIWDGVFELTYLENRGTAFGLLSGRQALFMVTTVLVFVIAVYAFFKIQDILNYFENLKSVKTYRFLQAVIILLMSGAVGNFIDRIFNGYVVDFFYFRLINFPVFNVADCYVVIAEIGLIIVFIFSGRNEELNYLITSKKKWNK